MTKQRQKHPARLLLLSVLGCAIAMSTARASDHADVVLARIEAPQAPGRSDLDALSLPALMERLHVPGLSIAVIKDFKIHWAKAYGVADQETGRALDTGTRFQSASISKPVTAMAVMRLVGQNRLKLDTDINAVLKSWKVPASALTRRQAVTARSLMSHTSGADDGFGFPGYAPGAPLPSALQILDGHSPSNVGKVTFAREPFESYKYSGGGLTIMQLALTELSAQPFAKFMHATVLAPLQMSRSSFEQPVSASEIAGTAFGHDENGRRTAAPWRIHPELAAAGLWTTPSDLARFMIEIQTALRGPAGKVLNQHAAREMTTPVGIGPYGIGLEISEREGDWHFSHRGDNWGYRAWMSGHLRKGQGIVIMTNGENGMALMNQVAGRISAAYNWK